MNSPAADDSTDAPAELRSRPLPMMSPPPAPPSTNSHAAPDRYSTNARPSTPNTTDSTTTSPAPSPLARRLNRTVETLTETQHLVAALNTWHDWAIGEDVPSTHLIKNARTLDKIDAHHAALAQPLATWIDQHDLAPRRRTPTRQPELQIQRAEPPGLDIGF